MNITDIGALDEMLGKAVEIDGCHIGYLKDMTMTQTIDGIKISIEVVPTDYTLDKLDEYSRIMSVMKSS